MKRLTYRRNKDGSSRCYYRHPNGALTRLPDLPENDPAFLAAYAKAAGAEPDKKTGRVAQAGTLAALIREYMRSEMWRELAPGTRSVRQRILSHIEDELGHIVPSVIKPDHIALDLGALKPHVARNRLKVWRGLFAWAVAARKLPADPSADYKARKPKKSTGHEPWAIEEIERFREHHPIGTDARLAFEICYWTAAASVDAVRLGRQMIGPDGWLRFSRQKTGVSVEIPLTVLPGWMDAVAEDHAHLLAALAAAPKTRMLWLETRHGTKRSEKAFGSWMARHAQAAGLPAARSVHGIRKARLNRLAEAGWSVHHIMWWAGHKTAAEAIGYTEKAEKRRAMEGERTGKTVTRAPESVTWAKK